ncbi:MAG: SAM-dependent methyltransferase [Clostridia bacterium]|nr:SAM-dependent methyltransferase [Clostridia bacterium]
MSKIPSLSPRLTMASALVRPGARFADVGTDHAYLPIHLLKRGQISYAVAADVAEGPLDRARENLDAAGLLDKVKLLLTDGLAGMEGLSLTDIAICGMGGELIAAILAAAPFVRDPALRLILQPMTKADALRTYLAAEGFSVFSERYAVEDGRVYLCLGATYDGEVRNLSRTVAVLGERAKRAADDREAFLTYLDIREREVRGRLFGKRAGGADTAADEALLAAIDEERRGV